MDALLQWGKERDYPALWCPPYAIGPGEYCWRMFCGLGKPEALQAAISVVQAIDAAQSTAIPDVSTIAALLPGEQQQAEEKGA